MLTDPIADFLTRLRNASHTRCSKLTVPFSRMNKAITELLVTNRFIESFYANTDQKIRELNIVLKKDREALAIKRISKPGQRIYVGYQNVKRVRNGLGIGIISTSRGVITDTEAREKKLGGEYICEIY